MRADRPVDRDALILISRRESLELVLMSEIHVSLVGNNLSMIALSHIRRINEIGVYRSRIVSRLIGFSQKPAGDGDITRRVGGVGDDQSPISELYGGG